MIRRYGLLVMTLLACFSVHIFHQQDVRTLNISREFAPPSWSHPFGCGDNGVDLLALAAAALIRGMLTACTVASFAFVVGLIMGGWAGLQGGVTEKILQKTCDFTQSFPSLVLSIGMLAFVARPSWIHVLGVLSITAWAPFARLALAELRMVRNLPFIEAARALGASPFRIAKKHAIPAVIPLLRSQWGTSSAALLVADAALAFLGVGGQDGQSLGLLLDQGVGHIVRAPHVLMSGAFTLALGSLSLQSLADKHNE